MSTGVIIAIAVVAVIIVALVIALIVRARSGERKLVRRRQEAAAESRQHAELKVAEAERAEHRARVAEAEAERHRAESRLGHERADAFEQGMADEHLRDGEDRPEGDGREVPRERAQT
jgi:flagellar biosynthesis/type III secretory pathway M-ring protein FliF/YscJ